MIEPEMAFYDVNDNMDLAEEFIKYCINYALDHCKDDIQFLNDHFDKELIDRLKFVVENDFVRLPYTEVRNSNSLFTGVRILLPSMSVILWRSISNVRSCLPIIPRKSRRST